MCGGTYGAPASADGEAGLSPRVRGNPGYNGVAAPGVRSIPACAGEPPGHRPPAGPRQVYPRVCGGTMAWPATASIIVGLSPRVRGNRPHAATLPPLARSIPACAGEPRGRWAFRPGIRVYPRVCGGTPDAWTKAASARGLSPRVRGNPAWLPASVLAVGSIPACAGEPRRPLGGDGIGQVYPRVCGGTVRGPMMLLMLAGLSPRVRGNHFPGESPIGAGGSIPACAGEPWSRVYPSGEVRVYPRVCGGTADRPAQLTAARGLSPRVRGNPDIVRPA